MSDSMAGADGVPDAGERAAPRTTWPAVGVVIPVVNEGHNLTAAVDRVQANQYPGEIQIVIAVGPSEDDTEAVATELESSRRAVTVVRNPSGRTPSGLNAAIAATNAPVIVRVDGHGFLEPGYIQLAVELLEATGAANVGGLMIPSGQGAVQRAVARAMASRIGIGGAQFHTGGKAGPALTVYLGVFRREVLERVGGFDEHFLRAQDWELNHRIRQLGEVVWFDPRLRVTYYPRSNYRALIRQFYTTGRWRREVVARYPETASPRYLAPPAAVIGVATGLAVGAAGAVLQDGRVAAAGFAVPGAYMGAVIVGSLLASREMDVRDRVHLPFVVMAMHLSWGLGFLRGV